MKQSLHRTWAALAVAALAVFVVAVLAVRDFARDVSPECPGGLRLEPGFDAVVEKDLDLVDVIDPKADPKAPRLLLRFDAHPTKSVYDGRRYSNVRIVRSELASDARECNCGALQVPWTPSTFNADPTELKVFRDRKTGLFHVKDGADYVMTLRATNERRHVFQPQRIVAMRNLPTAVVMLAFGALGIALLRSRRAITYASRLHAWTEATLTAQGRLEDDHGALLANLDSSLTSTRRRWPVPVGDVLVDPKALGASSLYREMPVVTRANVVEGGHARWTTSTMVQLRDARALAILSCMCTAAAFAARVLGA